MKKEDWKLFQDYIAERLKVIDPYARSSKASGACGEMADIQNNIELAIECKKRNTQSCSINLKTWKKLCEEIPFHSKRIPILALENKNKDRFAVLNLNTFLSLYIELIKYRRGEI